MGKNQPGSHLDDLRRRHPIGGQKGTKVAAEGIWRRSEDRWQIAAHSVLASGASAKEAIERADQFIALLDAEWVPSEATASGDPCEELAGPSWLTCALVTKDGVGIHQAFDKLYNELDLHFVANDSASLSTVLRALADHAAEVHPVILVAGLRLTWRAHHFISAWEDSRDRIAKAMENMGHDPLIYLAGLYA